MDDEKQGTNEEIPESEIQIIVTEEQPENVDDPESTDGSPIEKDKPDETKEDNGNVVDETEGATAPDESGGLKVTEYDFDSRRESTLLGMDKKHAWLSALEQKCVNLETDFISRIQFVAISNHCQNYLEQLSSDESTAQFQTEFSKLFKKFRIAFVESQRHINKINELKSFKNVANSENRQLKIQLDKESEKIRELHEKLDQAEDNLLDMEKQNKKLQNMFNEISEEKAKDSTKYEQVAEDKPLAFQDDDEAEAKIRQLEEDLELIGNELEFMKQRETMYQKKIKKAENTKASLQKEINSVKYEFQMQTTRAEKAEAVASENAEEVKNKNVVIKNMTEEMKQTTEDLGRAKDESRRLLKELRKCQKDLDGNAQVIEKLRKDLDIREEKIKMLVTHRDSLTIELSNKQSEITALKGDIAAITKVRNSLSRRVALLDERCSDVDKKLDSAKKEKAALIKELDLIKKELEESDIKTSELTKQKDALTEEAMKLRQTVSELENESKVLRDKGYNLMKELTKSKHSADLLTDKIKLLEKTKARLMKEIAEVNKNANDLRDEIKRLELIIAEMRKCESKLRQQLSDEYTKYELLADDERHCRRQLAESKHECEQLRGEQIVLRKHIENLQRYNQDLDDRCKKVDLNVKHLTEQLGNMKESYKQEVKNSDDFKMKLKHKEDQEQLLLRNLSEKEHDIFTFKTKAKNLIEEKNVQNAKIIEKDRQINDLKENLRQLQQEVTTLDKTVNERINDIKLLKIQISQMNKSNFLLNEQLEFMDDTRQGLFEAQSKLIEEKVKSKNLEVEMQKPVNLHRWRILEGIDPERAQLVAKNQVLQKQFNKKMAELDSKEVELREKEKQSRELQDLLKRRRESDTQEQLWICKKELKARMDRLKCLVTENDMFQNLCKKYEDEISALKDKLRAHKISEFKRRRVL